MRIPVHKRRRPDRWPNPPQRLVEDARGHVWQELQRARSQIR
jgi:hypothetical protein